MKNLINNILESKSNRELDIINEELITEGLKSKLLTSLAKQLKNFGSKHKDSWTNKSFSGILGSLPYKWDEITDDQFQHFEADDEKGKKLVRKIVTNSDRQVRGMCLITKPNTDTIWYFIYYGGLINLQEENYYNRESGPSPSKQYDIKMKDINYYCSLSDFYYLDFTGLDVWEIQRDRRQSRDGMVLQGDDHYYNNLAKENIERYKKILAKRKAEETARKDTLSKEVQDILNEVMDLSTQSMKDPEKYLPVRYEICSMIEEVYSRRSWGKNGATGHDGLLVLYKEYVDTCLSLIKDGGYSYQQDAKDKIIKDLKAEIQRVEDRIDRIHDKVK